MRSSTRSGWGPVCRAITSRHAQVTLQGGSEFPRSPYSRKPSFREDSSVLKNSPLPASGPPFAFENARKPLFQDAKARFGTTDEFIIEFFNSLTPSRLLAE